MGGAGDKAIDLVGGGGGRDGWYGGGAGGDGYIIDNSDYAGSVGGGGGSNYGRDDANQTPATLDTTQSPVVTISYATSTPMAVSECGTLSLPGKYQLTQNLSGGLLPDGNSFDITADGVSLDLQGHTITGGAGAKLVST